MLMLLVGRGHLESPRIRERHWYPRCVDADMKLGRLRKVPRVSPFLVLKNQNQPRSGPRPTPIGTREGEGKGKGRNLLWNDCFLVQEKEAASTLVPRIFTGLGAVVWSPGPASHIQDPRVGEGPVARES